MKKLTEQQKVRRQILFNMPYLLLTFLIKEKVLSSYLNNISEYTYRCNIYLESVYKNLKDPSMAFEYAFSWRYTKEGHNFWKELNDKYKNTWEINDSGALLLRSDYQYTY